MQNKPVAGLELAHVERDIAASNRWLKFSPRIEAAFASDTEGARISGTVVTTIAAIVMYDAYLINDWLALHDRFREMVVARLFIFTPVMLALIGYAHHRRSARTAEWSTPFGGALAVFLPMTVMIFSNSTHKLSYQYGSVLVMMFATVVQKVRFRPAAVAVMAMLFVQLTTTRLSAAFDTETYVAIVTFFVSAAALQLIAIYVMERAERHTYLFALRGRILHDQLTLSAQTDALTGLFNRRHLNDFTEALWTRTEPLCVSAILLDIDHFKLFNDSRGHLKGDDCLQLVSDCIRRAIADSSGAAFRFGGEEMVILLPGLDPDEASQLAHRIQQAIAKAAIPHPALGDDSIVTASFGIAGVMAPDQSGNELIAAADTALYAAKRAGRNRIWPRSPHQATRLGAAKAQRTLKLV